MVDPFIPSGPRRGRAGAVYRTLVALLSKCIQYLWALATCVGLDKVMVEEDVALHPTLHPILDKL